MRKVIIGKRVLVGICILAIVSMALSGCSSTAANAGVAATTMPNGESASISAIPSVSTVKPGENFDISIQVQNGTPARGAQFSLSWDPTKVECVSAEEGTYFEVFAQANDGDIFALPSTPVPDNTNGKFPKDGASPTNMAMAMTGAQGADGSLLGPTGTGVIYILHMTTKDGASGTVTFKLSNTEIGDNTAEINDMHPTVNNGEITISP